MIKFEDINPNSNNRIQMQYSLDYYHRYPFEKYNDYKLRCDKCNNIIFESYEETTNEIEYIGLYEYIEKELEKENIDTDLIEEIKLNFLDTYDGELKDKIEELKNEYITKIAFFYKSIKYKSQLLTYYINTEPNYNIFRILSGMGGINTGRIYQYLCVHCYNFHFSLFIKKELI